MTAVAISVGAACTATEAREKVEGLLDILRRLGELLAAEIEAVRASAPGKIAEYAAEKEYLALTYSDRIKELHDRPGLLRNVEAALIARLQAASESFRAVVAENARILKAAKSANERFIKAVSDAVSDRNRPALTYSKTGALGAQGRSHATGALSIALDRSV